MSSNKDAAGRPVSTPGLVDLHDSLHRLDRLASLGLVAASAAHEIKNALVAVHTFTDVMLEQTSDKEMASVVRRELKRIDSLVTQMLRFASPRPARIAPVAIHSVLDHSLRLLEHQMAVRNIVLRRDYRATPDTVHGDEGQLQQVFMNLMLNAVEAIQGGGAMTVQTETVADASGSRRLKIHFTDSGAGIPPEYLPRVFEPFFTTKQDGTGLGLAICQRVAQEHRGYIEVQSELGNGATFIVSLAAD